MNIMLYDFTFYILQIPPVSTYKRIGKYLEIFKQQLNIKSRGGLFRSVIFVFIKKTFLIFLFEILLLKNSRDKKEPFLIF